MDLSDIRRELEPALRKHGITAAARAVGVSDAAVHRWLGGHASLSIERVQSLARALGYELTVDYRLTRPSRRRAG